jgi:WD40 repeat protein
MVVLKDERLFTCGMDGLVKLWNVSAGVCVRTTDHGDGVKGYMDILKLHDGRLVLSRNSERSVYMWN